MSRRSALIVGAGVSGLCCARELAQGGWRVEVLERSRGVGGRCATRRVHGQAVDHGPAFLHGSSRPFLDDVRSAADLGSMIQWPLRVEGGGTPCQPQAFSPTETRIAFEQGLTTFAKHLAQGIDVRLETEIQKITIEDDTIVLRTGDGREWRSGNVVLALAVEQVLRLIEPVAPTEPEIAAAQGLLRMVGSHACLTVLSGFPVEAPAPPWDILYPEDSSILQSVSQDSRKRGTSAQTVLVAQARPCWSRRHLDDPPESWGALVVRETARLVGSWASEPIWQQTHRWRLARVDRGCELAGPLLLPLRGGARLGIAGELFAPGGGLQAAWESGRRLADRFVQERPHG